MDFLVITIILLFSFFLFVIWKFTEYKRLEKKYKQEIYDYISRSFSLSKSLEMAFLNLNNSKNLGLDHLVIQRIAKEISELNKVTDVENVVEIYSQFIHRYVFNNGMNKNPGGISREKIIYALENISFDSHGGYLVIKPDKDSDFDKKYPM